MKTAAVAFFVWALLLTMNVLVAVIFFNPSGATVALLGGAAGAVAIVALGMLVGHLWTRRADAGPERSVTDLSVASGWLGIGVALLVLSARFGVYLALISGGMILLGLAGVARELRSEPRARGRRLGPSPRDGSGQ